MNKLFVHNIWFRLFGPIFSGTLVYLLILLVNDAVLFIQEDFLSQELGVCIGLAYLTQEFSRFSLGLFERLKWPKLLVARMGVQLIGSIFLTMVLVSTAIYLYFTRVLLYEPSTREFYVFNSIFSFITVLYVVLYWAHYFLNKRNSEKLEREIQTKQLVEKDFLTFIKGIHPTLLFESLEAILVTMKSNPEKAEQLADDFSTVYRYLLSKRKREVVKMEEELSITKSFIRLCNHLPQRSIKLGKVVHENHWIVPTTLIRVFEEIVRTTIPVNTNPLLINVVGGEEHLSISYRAEERLQQSLTLEGLSSLLEGYRFYSHEPIRIDYEGGLKRIKLPKLRVS